MSHLYCTYPYCAVMSFKAGVSGQWVLDAHGEHEYQYFVCPACGNECCVVM